MLNERFSIPGVGGIITKIENKEEYILIQDREKKDAEKEKGLIEIPAGKIREFENIYDCLRRDVYEETGYIIEKIEGEDKAVVEEINNYKVLNYEPFSCSQNIKGTYPIMVQVFICRIKEDGKDHRESDESKNIRWEKVSKIKEYLRDKTKLYPMHITTLEKYCNSRK